jgi:hypothetical protein
LHVGFAQLGGHVEGAENFAAGEVVEAWDLAEDFALRAFACAGGAEEENGLVAGHEEGG